MTDFLWPLTALVGIGAGGYLYFLTLNRLHPEHVPEPNAKMILALFEEHKTEVNSRLDNIQGKLELRATRFGARE